MMPTERTVRAMSNADNELGMTKAWNSLVMQAAGRRLIESWRDRARTVGRYDRRSSELWDEAANELESAIGLPDRTALLERFLRGFAREVVLNMRGDTNRLEDDPRAPL